MLKGKMNDHIFHNACQTYLIKYYDSIRFNNSKTPIPLNIIWTNNFLAQYCYCQNFFHDATASSKHPHKPINNHKFGQK